MRYLLDTCVISEVRHTKGSVRVKRFVAGLETDAFNLSAITVGELKMGIASLPKGKRKNLLSAWLRELVDEHAERIHTVDTEIAVLWGELSARAASRGRQVSVSDGLIAATALRHGLTVLTRNVRDFEPTGVSVVNPWEAR